MKWSERVVNAAQKQTAASMQLRCIQTRYSYVNSCNTVQCLFARGVRIGPGMLDALENYTIY